MKILGIDYGRSKTGIALGDTDSRLAEPLAVLKFSDFDVLKDKIKIIVQDEAAQKLVVGISEGNMAEESRAFGNSLARTLKIPIEFVDETLTSLDAQRLAIEAGMQKKKRKDLEDAFSAALILQSYLDAITIGG